jgi:hypothetical protein
MRPAVLLDSWIPVWEYLPMSDGSGIIATEKVHVGVRALHIPVYLLKCLVVLQT